MNTIKFSHYYQKMPSKPVFEGAEHEVFQIFIIDSSELGRKYAKWDTAYEENGEIKYYPLPKGKLIVIYILSSNKAKKQAWSWQTIRRWTPRKEEYYRGLIGEKVNVVIEEGSDE